MTRGLWTIGVAGLLAATLAGCTSSSSLRAPAAAPQVTGVLGSPTATTTIDGTQLPAPPPKFGGVINLPGVQYHEEKHPTVHAVPSP